MEQHPIYRLKGGEVMVQESDGGRWTVLDDKVANAMLAAFNGLSLDAMRQTILAAGSDQAEQSVLRRVA